VKDPLTKKEHREILMGFQKQYYLEYQNILDGGMVDDECFEPHSHIVGRIALQVAAKRFGLKWTKYRVLEKQFV
jgi:hypothetical protein